MEARIYKPRKTAMQSGRRCGEGWVLEYELSTARAPEALMGWSAGADTMNQPPLKFQTLEDAKAFAQTQGIVYTVLPPGDRRIKPRNYGDNFVYRGEDS